MKSGICRRHCLAPSGTIDKKFSVADELLHDPELKVVFKAALEKGARLSLGGNRNVLSAMHLRLTA